MQQPRQLCGKRVVVMGLGKSGLAAARLLLREGAEVVGVDDRSASELGPEVAALREMGVQLKLGEPHGPAITADLVVKSPGVKPLHPLVIAFREAKVPTIGEVELCVPWLVQPIVAITGTNGKSTTTALIGHILTSAGQRPFVGGNLGTPVAEQVLSGHSVDATVLELSSYQIDDLQSFTCDVACILNITPDHLERYGTMERYAAAKERLLARVSASGLAIVNADDAATAAMAKRARCRVVTFGHGVPRTGHIREADEVIIRRTETADENYSVTALALRGIHNRENAMAAIEATRTLGISQEDVQRGLDSYPGLPHRIEFIRTRNGVDWINDSKATNVDSVKKSLAAFPGPLHLIMGGRGKGTPYAPLRSLFPGRVAGLYVIGEDASRIVNELGELARVEQSGDLGQAIAAAARNARPGDTVLLSPACASFDQFRSFEHRGDVFRQFVEALS